MFTLKVENPSGEMFTFTDNESRYQVVNADGLNPPNALIRSTAVAGMDGAKFMSSKLEERNIVLTIKINGDVERNRLNLYRCFKTKRWCKIYFKTNSRDVYIEGYVETVENNLFTRGQTVQISIICHDPYFKSMELIYSNITHILGAFEFPFAFGSEGIVAGTTTDAAIEFSTVQWESITNVYNEGESDTGVMIDITFEGEVTNPSIFNSDTGDSFNIVGDFIQGDRLIINTNAGEKSVTLIRDAVSTNYINHVARDSVWLRLMTGDNLLTYDADTGLEQMRIIFTHRAKFEAI